MAQVIRTKRKIASDLQIGAGEKFQQLVVAERQVIHDVIDENALRRLLEKLLEMGLDGDRASIRLLLDCKLGKAALAIDAQLAEWKTESEGEQRPEEPTPESTPEPTPEPTVRQDEDAD